MILKLLVSILFTLTMSISGYSQYTIDWRNAPLNPIPVQYTLNHFQLKGSVKKAVMDDLLGKQVLFFNSSGKLDSSIIDDFLGHEKKIFEYDSIGNLTNIISQKKYGTPISNYVSFNSSKRITLLNRILYEYNQAGFLIAVRSEESSTLYNYNKENQLSKKEVFDASNNIQLTVYYTYKQFVNHIRIEENRVHCTDQEDHIWTYDYDTLGHLFSETNVYDSIGNYLGPTPNKTEALLEYYNHVNIKITDNLTE